MDFHTPGAITIEGASFKNAAHALTAANKCLLAMEKIKETYHESNTPVSPTIRTDL
jgi:hypothetical protein